MGSKILSIIEAGMDGLLVEIECHLSNGLPAIVIVGSANKAVDEAKERLRGAFASSKLILPKKRITINLAPGDIPKDSAGLDMAIAVAIMQASEQTKAPTHAHQTIFIGELGLDGKTRPVRGIIGKLTAAKKHDVHQAFIPIANLAQASLVPGIALYPVESLTQLYTHLSGGLGIQAIRHEPRDNAIKSSRSGSVDMADVSGQQTAKRALEIAAAGGHNILLNGPPGTGKSMLAKAMVGILPPMNSAEILEVTQLHSLANRDFDSIIVDRPFRTPHHTASNISIIGGGQRPKPGEISLSHRGILFLDELLEFDRSAIESLRQPLEDRTISVARASGSIVYPAHFMLVATSNPCPCGYYGSSRVCECLPFQIAKYQRKLSGPIVDRIDMYVDVDEVAHTSLLHVEASEASQDIANRVQAARTTQEQRFKKLGKMNSDMDNKEVKSLAKLTDDAEGILNKAAESMQLSPRTYMRSIKVARTIADLDQSPTIESKHIAEALQYRRREQTFL